MCAKSLQSCLTLCDPMDCNSPGSSVHGILQARILEWVAMPSSRGLSNYREQTRVSWHWLVGSLPLVPPGKTFTIYHLPFAFKSLSLLSAVQLRNNPGMLMRTVGLPKVTGVLGSGARTLVLGVSHFITCAINNYSTVLGSLVRSLAFSHYFLISF